MRKDLLPIIFLLLFASTRGIVSVRAQGGEALETTAAVQGAERSLAAESSVVVTLCTASGDVTVRGWDRREVRARSREAAAIELQRGGNDAASTAAARVGVVIADSTNSRHRSTDGCQASSDVELDVPRGASLELKTLSGDVVIEDMAEARVQTVSGNTLARHINKGVEVVGVSGDIKLENSSGAARLRSVSGLIEVRDANPASAGDDLEVTTTSGNVRLERIGHARVEAASVSGNLDMTGQLARGGRYRFRTVSGDVELLLPPDASFQFTARVSRGGNVIFTNLPFKFDFDNSTSTSRLVNGFFGTGDATLNLTSFSGTLRLRRK